MLACDMIMNLYKKFNDYIVSAGHGGEDSSKDNKGGYLKPPYSSATVSSLADMLIRNSQEPFYVPIPPSGVCATTNAFDLNRPGPGHSCSGSGSGCVSSSFVLFFDLFLVFSSSFFSASS